MPDVRITNPEVAMDLNSEAVQVPTGERWIVDIATKGSNATRLENSATKVFHKFSNTRLTRVRLSAGDVIVAESSTITAVRGVVIST